MRLYRVFLCFVFLGLLAGAAYSQTDPGVGLRGDGLSTPIGPIDPNFAGTFPGTTCADTNPNTETTVTNCLDYFNNYQSSPNNTFIALNLVFTNPLSNPSLTYSCDNSLDPFFLYCSASGNVVKFYGVSSEVYAASVDGSSNLCPDGDCQGIPSGDVASSHFSLFLTTGDRPSFMGVADLAVVTTPEPASALLFVIGIGAIALFLKRA
jgi:hypothetical protein